MICVGWLRKCATFVRPIDRLAGCRRLVALAEPIQLIRCDPLLADPIQLLGRLVGRRPQPEPSRQPIVGLRSANRRLKDEKSLDSRGGDCLMGAPLHWLPTGRRASALMTQGVGLSLLLPALVGPITRWRRVSCLCGRAAAQKVKTMPSVCLSPANGRRPPTASVRR